MSNDVEMVDRVGVWPWIGIVVTIIWVVGPALAILMDRQSSYYASQLQTCRELFDPDKPTPAPLRNLPESSLRDLRNQLQTYENCAEGVEVQRRTARKLGNQVASALLGLGLLTATVFWAIVGLVVWVVRVVR
jgi:hypothetical protein